MEQMDLGRIAKRYGIEMEEWPLPSAEDVEAIVSERVTVLLEARLRDRDRLKSERMERFEPLIHDLRQSEEGLALLTMLVDDYYQQTLHAPPPQPPSSGAGTQKGAQKKGQSRKRGGRRRRRR
jgi:ATP-dependent RNA helicase DeaD